MFGNFSWKNTKIDPVLANFDIFMLHVLIFAKEECHMLLIYICVLQAFVI